MESQRQRPGSADAAQAVVTILSTVAVVGLQAWVLWLQISPQERMWIRLAVAGRVRRLTARMAWAQGRAGMAEELQTKQRSFRYLVAWGLSTVRDQAARQIEAMKP